MILSFSARKGLFSALSFTNRVSICCFAKIFKCLSITCKQIPNKTLNVPSSLLNINWNSVISNRNYELKMKGEWVRCVGRNLARPVFAVEVADDAFAGLDDGEEVFLGGNLGIFGVAEGDPAGALLRHLLHLLEAALAEGLDVIGVQTLQGGDLVVDLVLHGLRHRQDLLLDHLFDLTLIHLPLPLPDLSLPSIQSMNNESIRRRLSSSLLPSSPIVWTLNWFWI